MKNTLLTISTVLIILLTIVLGGLFSSIFHQEKLQNRIVKIAPKNKMFIKVDEVKKMLHITDSAAIDIKHFEKKLADNHYIDSAEVYLDLNGNLIAEVTQFKPIARIMGNKSYYLDEKGNKKPLSHHYTEKVVLVYGDISQKKQKEIYDLINKIYHDKLLNEIVSEIHIENHAYKLRVKNIKASFILNNHISKAALHKLKVMYAYLKKNKLVNKYHQIDLRYKKQAVCK